MAMAGIVVMPVSPEQERGLLDRLKCVPGLEVQAVGPKGIALTLEHPATAGLKKLSEEISSWEEVLELELAYLNWENDEE
jgi:nitrate reductase NapAB chaperone NapD